MSLALEIAEAGMVDMRSFGGWTFSKFEFLVQFLQDK